MWQKARDSLTLHAASWKLRWAEGMTFELDDIPDQTEDDIGSPLTVQWTVDTFNLAKSAAKSVSEAGGTKWYFLTVDQAYGHALSRDTIEQVKLLGGEVVGNSVFPPNTSEVRVVPADRI